MALSLALAIHVNAQSQQLQLANEYFQQGDYEKAKSLYDDLSKDRRNIPQLNSNYIEVLKQLGEPKEITKYFEQITAWFPGNIGYVVDKTAYYFESGDLKSYQKEISDLKKQYAESRFQLSIIGQEFASKQLYEQAADFLILARAASGHLSAYALDLARIYSYLNEKGKMVDEYLTFASENRQNAAYIKNIFQDLLKDDKDLSYLETTLITRMQKNPNDRTFSDLMIWVELQRKNFYGAFIQSKALDKREQTNGSESTRVGRIAMDNGSWDDAISIFDYLTKTYTDPASQAYYRKLLVEAKEGKIKNTYPINRSEIKALSREYVSLYQEMGPNNTTLEALRNLARLHAFYLDEIDTAAIVLRFLIESPRVHKQLSSECKLDLGDIYLLKGQPWEATLLFSQVEKDHRDSPLAYEAKLKNARLHYYNGNFSLAKSHLDILKRATTREISNDAIDISVLISDNTYLDSTDAVMEDYAKCDLLIFRNQLAQAERALKQMLVKHKNHSITDEVYWQLAMIATRMGHFETAIDYLEKITVEYGYDILADDAAFKIALITEEQLHDSTKALTLYEQFMLKYPGSMYTADARNRFRKLRGDYNQTIN
jgi:TolA-binding protein